MNNEKKQVKYLVVDTTAFIQNASLHNIAENIVTCQEVVDEVTNKRQLRRLVALPYDLVIKNVLPENVKLVTEFSKKTGDYPSLSATDIMVMALTYQLELEKVGAEHLRTEPILPRPQTMSVATAKKEDVSNNEKSDSVSSNEFVSASPSSEDEDEEWLTPPASREHSELRDSADLASKFEKLNVDLNVDNNILVSVKDKESSSSGEEEEDDDDEGWITPANLKEAQKQINSELMEEKRVTVACMTTDFAMQNVLKQMNLNVSALDGRIIKQLRTYILRCYACGKTTSIMTKMFCPKCGNNTLKKVAVSVNENGETNIHINWRRPLTGRGKKFSLPKIQGGKHPNNPLLVEDQPRPHNMPTRMARMKNNPLNDDYIAGYSPFVTRDVYSKSALLGIRNGAEFKQWMKKNPNESRKKRK